MVQVIKQSTNQYRILVFMIPALALFIVSAVVFAYTYKSSVGLLLITMMAAFGILSLGLFMLYIYEFIKNINVQRDQKNWEKEQDAKNLQTKA